MLTARKLCSSRMVVSPTSRANALKSSAVVTAMLALFCAVSNAGNYRPPDKIENQQPAGGLVMDYAQDKQLIRAARGRRGRFDVFDVGADIADMGKGERDNLARIGRVGQDFLIAGNRRVETDLADR